jgi:pyridoxamine 5'-phosphate oxidase
MSLQEYLTFANQNPVVSVATVEGDQPRVRKFLLWFADETGFYFHTGTTKVIYQQLLRNPKVELCFYNPGNAPGCGMTMRVAGEVEFLHDLALNARLIEERPFLKAIGTGRPDNPLLAVFRIPHGEAWF